MAATLVALLGLCAAGAAAQTSAASSAFGEQVTANLLPLLGGGVSVSSGPLPTAGGSAAPPYDVDHSVASASVSLPIAGNLLQTGILNTSASSLLPSGTATSAEAVVDDLSLKVVGNLPLLTLTADVVEARAAISGPCGRLTASGESVLANARVGGALGLGLQVTARPAPNTVLLNLAGIRVMLNEQFVGGDGVTGRSITVNAIHIYLNNVLLTLLGLLNGDIVVSHAHAELTCGANEEGSADLSLEMVDAPDPATVDGALTYELTVHNDGPQAATGVVLTDLLPGSVTLISTSASQGGCDDSDLVTCDLGTIDPGGDATVVIDVVPSSEGTIVNTASVDSDLPDPDPGNNSASASTTIEPPASDPPPESSADLQVTADEQPNPAQIESLLTYEIEVVNTGPSDAPNVTLIATLPAAVEVTEVSTSQGSCSGTATVSCSLGTLPDGASATVEVTGIAHQSGSLVFHAVATSSLTDPNPADNEVLLTTLVTAPPVESAERARCRSGVVPAASLLVPYFAVDLSRGDGITTLFAITNTHPVPRLAHVTLWTDWAVPTLTFDVYLTGYDVQTINLRDVLAGHLPATGSGISPQGALSSTNAHFSGCVGAATELGEVEVSHLEARHTGRPSPLDNQCAASTRELAELATGYATIDVVTGCSTLTPADSGYFGNGGTGVASNANALLGDFFLVDAANNYSQGEAAVHLVADGSFANGPTFYGRYNGWRGTDNRQPLGSRYAARYIVGGAFTGGTEYLVWRDTLSPAAEAVACGSTPSWFPLKQNGVLAFDEEENPHFLPPDNGRMPEAISRLQVGERFMTTAEPFGWLSLDLAAQAPAAGLPDRSQGWVMLMMNANGRFGVGLHAAQLDEECSQ